MIGTRYKYHAKRTGECIDVSKCKQWVLLKRDDVWKGEQDKIAVLYCDPDLVEIAA
jgi:hypothetical protein